MKYKIKDDILIIEADDHIDRDLIKGLKESFESSVNKLFPIVLWKNILGYYSAYDFESNCSVYCGTTSQKTSLEQINKYKNEI